MSSRNLYGSFAVLVAALFILQSSVAQTRDPLQTGTSAGRRSAKVKTVKVSGITVMLLIDEKNLGTIPTSEVEAAGAQMLREAGFEILDRDLIKTGLKSTQEILKMAGDPRGAAALGLQLGADIVVIGEAVAKPSARRIADSNLRTYEAVVTLRAVQADSARNLSAVSKDAAAVAVDDIRGSAQALRKAAKAAFEAAMPEMAVLEAAANGQGKGGSVSITVGGVDQLWKLKRVREGLKKLEGKFDNLRQKSYTTGSATFTATAKMPIEELAEAIVLSAPEGLGYQVLHISAGKLDMKLVERQ